MSDFVRLWKIKRRSSSCAEGCTDFLNLLVALTLCLHEETQACGVIRLLKGGRPVKMGLYCCHSSKRAIFYLKSITRTWSCQSSLLFVVHSTSLSPLQSCNYSMVNSFPEPIISCTVSFLFCSRYNRGAELLSIYRNIHFHDGNTVEKLLYLQWTENKNVRQWELFGWNSPDSVWHVKVLTSAALIVNSSVFYTHIGRFKPQHFYLKQRSL